MNTKTEKSSNIKHNITAMLINSLCLVTALGFNELMLTIFNRFKRSNLMISQLIYVLFMFFSTIGLAYYFRSNII
jgi:hypothetical protein